MKKLLKLSILSASIIFGTALAQTLSPSDQNNGADETTESSCIDLSTKVLKYKSRDSNTNGEVSVLQDYLNDKGFLTQGATGFYGLKTVDAVKKFQKNNGILTTGSVGALTKKFIYNDTCVEEKMNETSVSPTIKSEVMSLSSDPKKVSINVTTLPSGKISGDSSAGIQWGNDTFSLASKPDAKDKWRDRLNIKDLYTDSYLKVSFNATKPFADPSMYEKVDRVNSFYDSKNTNNAIFWGKTIVVSSDTIYTMSIEDFGNGKYRRVILDNKVLFESKGMQINEKTAQVLLKAGSHDLEVEFMQDKYGSEIRFAFMPTSDLDKIKDGKVEEVIPKNSAVSYVGVLNSRPGKVTVNLVDGFRTKYIIVASSKDTEFQFIGDTSSVLGVYSSNGLTSKINGFRDGVVSYGSGSLRNYDGENFPAVASLDYQCQKFRFEGKLKCSTFVNADELLRMLKVHNYTLSSFAGGSNVKRLEMPGLVFNSNEEVKKYMENSLQKATEEAEKEVLSDLKNLATSTPR